jgi:hypothetical protein
MIENCKKLFYEKGINNMLSATMEYRNDYLEWRDMRVSDHSDKEEVIQSKQRAFCAMHDDLVSRFGVICRILLSDDPKAELTKIVADLLVLLSPPTSGTVEEFHVYYEKALKTYNELIRQYELDIPAFLATIQVSTEKQTD